MDNRLTVYRLEYEDLWFRKAMLEDEKTMSYNHAWGGTIEFPEDDWQSWYDHWIIKNEDKRYYRYLKDDENFVGEIAYHFDEELKGYIVDIIIHDKYRGKGYGELGLKILCEIAKKNGIRVLYDDIAIDNKAISLFKRNGFKEEYRTEEKIILKKEL